MVGVFAGIKVGSTIHRVKDTLLIIVNEDWG